VFRSPSDTARSPEAVAKLLRDLGPQLRRGGAPAAPRPPLPTGIPEVDRLLGGGIPGGRLSEIAGPPSSGRTSLALALLARTTRAGVVAVVDAADAFDPASAESMGVDLERVLWVRAPSLRETLRSTESLLSARGFTLVVLDLAVVGRLERLAPAVGPRLARLAAATGTPLVALCLQRMLGTAAEVAIELTPTRASFTGTPTLLEDLEIEVTLVRHRTGQAQRSATVRLSTIRAA
jgi:hypothetical protein